MSFLRKWEFSKLNEKMYWVYVLITMVLIYIILVLLVVLMNINKKQSKYNIIKLVYTEEFTDIKQHLQEKKT
ncbi:hypothetical protein A1E_03695 [Rickettsia canadensis str. McKiel]|uniref:Uncharacterized protein n=1 Tax=Rickettsia canadensis (strain McKiel) TaxID=293613 RepID=A8EZ87_RICCK|nr:hypothetical protein A1E_03695 [Rickettsia canadensis str. McKiel]